MLVAELQELEEVKNLLSKGQQVGVLTFGEIASAVSEVDVDEGDIEELYGHLERSGIELVEDVDPAQATAPERDDGKRGKRRSKTTIDLKPDMTTDSLQLFLKDIGKVRLLTAAEEVELLVVSTSFWPVPMFSAVTRTSATAAAVASKTAPENRPAVVCAGRAAAQRNSTTSREVMTGNTVADVHESRVTTERHYVSHSKVL